MLYVVSRNGYIKFTKVVFSEHFKCATFKIFTAHITLRIFELFRFFASNCVDCETIYSDCLLMRFLAKQLMQCKEAGASSRK